MFDESFDFMADNGVNYDVSWNMDGEDVMITEVSYVGEDGMTSLSMNEAEFYDYDEEVADEVLEYIYDEYVNDNDFWFDKAHPNL